jgi:hypothetical protein
MRQRRSQWALAMDRDMRLDRLRFARMVTMTIIHTPARPTDITGQVTLWAASLSAQAPGSTAIMDRDITGGLTITAMVITAEAAIGDTGAIGTADEVGVVDVIGTADGTGVVDVIGTADATGVMDAIGVMDSPAGEAYMAVADSTVAMAAAGNQQFGVGTNRKVGVMAPAFGVCWRLAVGSLPNTVGLAPEALPPPVCKSRGFFSCPTHPLQQTRYSRCVSWFGIILSCHQPNRKSLISPPK